MRALRQLPVVSALCLVAASDARAQFSEGGRFEIGAIASYATFDVDRLGFSNDFGAGLRAGWYLTHALSLELIAARILTTHATAGATVDLSDLGASLVVAVPAIGRNRLFVGAGVTALSYDGWAQFRDQALHVLLGDRIPLSRSSALILEARWLRTSATNAPTALPGEAVSMRFSAGVSFFFAELAARDRDGDLVPDRADLCPGSSRREIVDATGCARDSDADEVANGADMCPTTEPNDVVDANGCAIDSDEDGVPDSRDRCAATETGLGVDANGCPPDTDLDGVINVRDRCHETAAGVAVDAIGCPRDSDDDRVPDAFDRCPDSAPGQEVDAVGCQILFVVEEGKRQPLVLRGVGFELGSAVLTDSSFEALQQVAASLVVYPEVQVEVAGHTDDAGSREFNTELSLARATTVREFLISRGVRATQLVARGYGVDQPVASNATEAGRAQNRRVELRPIERE